VYSVHPWAALIAAFTLALVWAAVGRAQILIPPTGNVYDVKIRSKPEGEPPAELCLIRCGDNPYDFANHFDCIPVTGQGDQQVIQTVQTGDEEVCVEGIARTAAQSSEQSAEQATLLRRVLAPILGLLKMLRGMG
jgi:hypothetical protein